MTGTMTQEEFKGLLKRYGFTGTSAICHVLLMKTGVVLRPQSVNTHLERYGRLSPSLTATFRLLSRELERCHEQIG